MPWELLHAWGLAAPTVRFAAKSDFLDYLFSIPTVQELILKGFIPVLLVFAALPATAVTPRVQHACMDMGHFAGQVQQARQSGMPATQVRRQVGAAHGNRAEHQLWRAIIGTVYQLPVQASTDQVNRSFYANCMSQMSRKRR